jgi:DNA-binding transcriptional ArsR family regulator
MIVTTDPQIEDLAASASEAAALLKALANEHRMLVLCHLISDEELSVGELVDKAKISQSALSQHLSRLRDEGLVTYRREAQTLYYRVADPRAARLLALMRDIFCPELAETKASKR